MTMTLAADLAAIYAMDDDMTVSATFGSETTPVVFSQGDVDGLAGDRLVREYAIQFPAAVFAGIGRNDSVTVAGAAYRVLDVRVLENGDEKVARLSRVA